MATNNNRRRWGQEEDDAILELVSEEGTNNWTQIAQLLKDRYGISDRSGKQCRERWRNHLDPRVSKEEWTLEEEQILFDFQQRIGNKWADIALRLPGRTDNAVKNHFYSTMRKEIRQYNKKLPKTQRLTGSVKQLLKNQSICGLIIKNYQDRKLSQQARARQVQMQPPSIPAQSWPYQPSPPLLPQQTSPSQPQISLVNYSQPIIVQGVVPYKMEPKVEGYQGYYPTYYGNQSQYPAHPQGVVYPPLHYGQTVYTSPYNYYPYPGYYP